MKKYLLGAVLAAGLVVAFLPQQASAYWSYRTNYRWDSYNCSWVCYRSCFWVPDCDPYDPYCEGGYYGGNGGYGGGGDYDSYSFRHGGRHDFARHHHRR